MKRILTLLLVLTLFAGCNKGPEYNEKREKIEVLRAAYPEQTTISDTLFQGERVEIINEKGIRVYMNSLSNVDGYKGFIYDIYNDNDFDITFQTDGMITDGVSGLGILYQEVGAKHFVQDVALACFNLPTSEMIEVPSSFSFFYAATDNKKQTDLIERKELVIFIDGILSNTFDLSGDKTTGEATDATVLSVSYDELNKTHVIDILVENTTTAYVAVGQWKVEFTEEDGEEHFEGDGHDHGDELHFEGDGHDHGDIDLSQWEYHNYLPVRDDINSMAFLRPFGKGVVRVYYDSDVHYDGYLRLDFTSTPTYVSGSIVDYRGPGVACQYYPQSDESVIISCVH